MVEAIIRIFWLIAGFSCLSLAAIGALLPLMPTTIFVILAAYCFARSSPALHDRLLNSTFGPAIRDWRDRRAISRKGKIAAIAAMGVSLLIPALLQVNPTIIAVQAVALLCVGIFIVTRNTA